MTSHFEPSAYPVESILQELRGTDGELYRSESAQRLYLIFKDQIMDSLYRVYWAGKTRKSPGRKDLYTQALTAYDTWSRQIREEELKQMLQRNPEVEELWKEVAMIYVRLCHKYSDAKTVRIKRPELDELLQNFFQNAVRSLCCKNGELWSYDHVKLDFTLREFFRRAVMDSVHTVKVLQQQQQKKSETTSKSSDSYDVEDDIYPDDSISTVMQQAKQTTKKSRKSKQEETKENDAEADLQEEQQREKEKDREQEQDAGTMFMGSSSKSRMVDDATVFGKFGNTEDADSEEEHVEHERRDDATVYASANANEDSATVFHARPARNDTATVVGKLTAHDSAKDSATVINKKVGFAFADSATVARPFDAGSTVSSTSSSSSSSRFSKLTAPRIVPLQSSLPAIDEVKRVPLSGAIKEEDSEDEEPPLRVVLPNSF